MIIVRSIVLINRSKIVYTWLVAFYWPCGLLTILTKGKKKHIFNVGTNDTYKCHGQKILAAFLNKIICTDCYYTQTIIIR